MCGRYSVVSKPEIIEKKFLASFNTKFEPVYNAAPSLKLPVITLEDHKTIQAYRWGFVPHYETNVNKGFINARSEGIHTSKAFLKSIRERRCLVIANCFYEWRQTTPKIPYLIYCEDQRLFAFAGIYRTWIDKSSGESIDTFAILTTKPNPLMDVIGHHRHPVILNPNQYNDWLNPDTSLNKITKMIAEPYDYKKMNAYEVSPAINKPANNTKDIMQPVGERLMQEVIVNVKSSGIKRGKDKGDGKTLGERI